VIARQPGPANVRFALASQAPRISGSRLLRSQTSVTPGPYRFRAFIRTEGLTTDQGIRFRVSDAEVPARLDVILGQFTGTKPWSDIEQELVIPPATRLLQVQVVRESLMRFDNKVAGTAWIDELRLEPTSTQMGVRKGSTTRPSL